MISHATWPPPAVNATFLVGASGSACDALAHAICMLPSVVCARPREGTASSDDGPNYFSIEDRFTRGMEWYTSHFELGRADGAPPTQVIDASQSYLAAPYAAMRARASLDRPAAHRIIIVLRDPVELAWASWRKLTSLPASDEYAQLARPYLQPRNFTAKVTREAAALHQCLDEQRRERDGGRTGERAGRSASTYVTRDAWHRCIAIGCGWPNCVVGSGLYAPQLRAWRQAFGGRQLRVLTLNQLHGEGATSLREILSWMGLPGAADRSLARHIGPSFKRRRAKAAAFLQDRTAAAVSAGHTMPAAARSVLERFYAAHARGLRRELELSRQPVRTAEQEPWLWADTSSGGHTAAAAAAQRWGEPDLGSISGRISEREQAESEPRATMPSVFMLGGEK